MRGMRGIGGEKSGNLGGNARNLDEKCGKCRGYGKLGGNAGKRGENVGNRGENAGNQGGNAGNQSRNAGDLGDNVGNPAWGCGE